MKTLILLRHAKSSWKDQSLQDIDRPLKDRGIKASALIGNYIRKRKIVPDLIISSPAERTRQTAQLVLKAARQKIKPEFDEQIYEAGARRLLALLKRIADTATVVMIIGHNPGLEDLIESLTGKTPKVPTAALARIELGIVKWNRVRPGVGKLKWLVTPKELKRVE